MLKDRKVDKSVPIPLYYQLKKIILEEIENGNYPTGSMIPTEDELCTIFDMSRTTVRQAITDLTREHKLYRIKGKGTFVDEPLKEWAVLGDVPSTVETVIQEDCVSRLEVLKKEVIDVPLRFNEWAFTFKCEKVVHVMRLHYVNEEPIIVSNTYVDFQRAPFVLEHDLTKEKLYTILEKTEETRICKIHRKYQATVGERDVDRLINLTKTAPVLRSINYGLNKDGILIELTSARRRGDSGMISMEYTV